MAGQYTDSKRAKYTRNRTGCHNCKKRKKRCGEEKPICNACKRLNLKCDYEVKLVWSRKKMVTSKPERNPNTVKPGKVIHLLSYFSEEVHISELISYYFESNLPTKWYSDRSIKQLIEKHYRATEESIEDQVSTDIETTSELEEKLFQHYVNVVSKTKSFSDSKFNEFRTLIIPNSIISKALNQSILAIASNDMYKNEPRKMSFYAKLANKYKNDAISSMYSILDAEPNFVSNQTSYHLNEIVSTILILCSMEISDKGNIRWISHLKEASLVLSALSISEIMDSNILLFAYRYFTLRYILLLTTLNREELNSFMSANPWPMISAYFEKTDTDHLLGCSPHLLFLIHQMTLLRNRYDDFNSKAFLIEHSNLRNQLWTLGEQKITLTHENKYLAICSEAYYVSAKLYFSSCFIEVERKTLTFTNSAYWSNINDTLISRVLDRLKSLISLNSPQVMNLFPTWCLFMTTICYPPDDKKLQILGIFDALEGFWPAASPYKIQQAVKCIWGITDLVDKSAHNGSVDSKDIISSAGFKLALT